MGSLPAPLNLLAHMSVVNFNLSRRPKQIEILLAKSTAAKLYQALTTHHTRAMICAIPLSLATRQQTYHPPQCEKIPLTPTSRDHCIGPGRHERMLPKRLSFMDVRNMNFNHRPFKRRQSIQNRHRSMGICCRIDDDPRRRPPRLLNPVNQLALMIGLQKPD